LWRNCVELVERPLPPWRDEDDHDPMASALCVKSMRLGSSWEALLTVVADKSAPLLYGGAALVALQRLLKMLMDWQQHRMNLRERRAKFD
jgi:hypothetical protein